MLNKRIVTTTVLCCFVRNIPGFTHQPLATAREHIDIGIICMICLMNELVPSGSIGDEHEFIGRGHIRAIASDRKSSDLR